MYLTQAPVRSPARHPVTGRLAQDTGLVSIRELPWALLESACWSLPTCHRASLVSKRWNGLSVVSRPVCTCKWHYRCGHPGQQQGRRLPRVISEQSLAICSLRVSAFLTDTLQQIHSLRASGVRLFHAAATDAERVSAVRISGGMRCATPEASFIFIVLVYQNHLRAAHVHYLFKYVIVICRHVANVPHKR